MMIFCTVFMYVDTVSSHAAQSVQTVSGLTSLSSSLLTINIFEIVIRQLNEH